jgi:hypothetical protein
MLRPLCHQLPNIKALDPFLKSVVLLFISSSPFSIIQTKNMAPRRSTRIATVVSAAAPKHADIERRNLRKRKASNEGVDERKTSKEKKKVPIKEIENSKAKDQTRSVPPGNDGLQRGQTAPEDALSVLPAEIQQKILANVREQTHPISIIRSHFLDQ